MKRNFAISKGGGPVLLRIGNFRDKGDGTSDADISYDEDFVEEVKKSLSKEEVSKEEISQFVNGLFEKAVNGIDGFKIVEEKR